MIDLKGKKARTMQEQVYKNMEDIDKLAEYLKPCYRCNNGVELNTASISVAKNLTNADASVKNGWLMDNVGSLFKITGGDDDSLLLDFYGSLRGPQGESGATLSIDDSTTSNTKVWSSNKTNSEVNLAKYMQIIFNTTETPTYDSENDGYIFTKANVDPMVDAYSTGKTLVQIVDNKIKYIYSIVQVTTYNVIGVLIGEVGGGKQLYQHNIKLQHDAYSLKVWFNFISDSNTAITSEAGLVSALKDTYTSINNALVASGCFLKSGTNYTACAVFVYNNSDVYVSGTSGVNIDNFTNVNVDTTVTDTVQTL